MIKMKKQRPIFLILYIFTIILFTIAIISNLIHIKFLLSINLDAVSQTVINLRLAFNIGIIIIYLLLVYGLYNEKKWTLNLAFITLPLLLVIHFLWAFYLKNNQSFQIMFYSSLDEFYKKLIQYTFLLVAIYLLVKYKFKKSD